MSGRLALDAMSDTLANPGKIRRGEGAESRRLLVGFEAAFTLPVQRGAVSPA
jgi:hypothetical protein